MIPLIEWVQQGQAWVQHHPMGAGGVVAGTLALCAAGGAVQRRWTGAAPGTRGSAHWATARAIQQAGLFAPHGVVLGKIGRRLLRDHSLTHVLVIGPTRAGKGIGIVVPSLAQWRGSALVLDPKGGENYDITAPWRERSGPTYAFQPYQAPGVRLNVYDSVRWRTPQELDDLGVISRSLTAPATMARESSESLHFRDLACLLLDAVGLHIGYRHQQKALPEAWRFLTQQHRRLAEVLTTMETTAHVAGGVHPAVQARVGALRNISGDRELSSVWTTAIRPLEPYSHPYVAASTGASDVAWDSLQGAATPSTWYLRAANPLSLEVLAPVYRVVLEVALEVGMRRPVRTWQQPLLTVGDDLTSYGYLRSMQKGITVRAGYGQKDLLIVQDLGSLWETYGPHSGIWGNTHIKVFFAPVDDETAHRLSRQMLGQETVTEQSWSRRGRGVRTVSQHAVGRALLTPDEVLALDGDQIICRVGHMPPILARRIDYRRERRLWH